MPDPIVVAALALVLSIALLVGLAWSRRRRAGPRRGLHTMDKMESFQYFRDWGTQRTASGVREEDRAHRWGAARNRPAPAAPEDGSTSSRPK